MIYRPFMQRYGQKEKKTKLLKKRKMEKKIGGKTKNQRMFDFESAVDNNRIKGMC